MDRDRVTTQPSCADTVDEQSLSAGEAVSRILDACPVLRDSETLAIRQALGRTLASDVLSGINIPPATNSAMDGYALAGSSLPNAHPREFAVTGTAWAGRPFRGFVEPDQCVRIMTGAIMPPGTDTVIMQEQVEGSTDRVRIGPGHRPGQNVRKAGEDLSVGSTAVAAGRRLTPADIGLLASLGIAEVTVTRPLRVAFFSTGDELKGIGEALSEGQIYDSNRYTLHAMLSQLGVDIMDLGVIPDRKEAIRAALLDAASDADAIITTGGVSVGAADYIKEALREVGDISFWKIAIKPGRPLAFGRIQERIFFGLPGNPVAVMVTFYQFVQPALRRMAGENPEPPRRFRVPCLSELKKRPGRVEFQRGILRVDDTGRLVVYPAGRQGSGILSSMSKANCFIVLPKDAGPVTPETLVEVEPFEGLMC